MKKTILLALILSLFLVVGYVNYKCRENILDPSKWIEVKGNALIKNDKLELCSNGPQQGCEIQSKNVFHLYCELEVKLRSNNWAIDTSFGLETWIKYHYGLVVTRGNLGIINHSISGQISDQEHYEPIIGWNSLKNNENVLKLKWYPEKVELYVNGLLNCQYIGPKVPDVPLKIRLNASNDFKDCLFIDYIYIFDDTFTTIFRDDFNVETT